MNNPLQMLQMLQANPVQILRRMGLSIPDGVTGPQQIVEYLARTGQVSQDRLNQAQQMASQLRSNGQWK